MTRDGVATQQRANADYTASAQAGMLEHGTLTRGHSNDIFATYGPTPAHGARTSTIWNVRVVLSSSFSTYCYATYATTAPELTP